MFHKDNKTELFTPWLYLCSPYLWQGFSGIPISIVSFPKVALGILFIGVTKNISITGFLRDSFQTALFERVIF